MLPLAYFGIESNAFTTAVDLLIVVGAVIYLSLVYWTYADARRRIVDPMLIGCATAASLFPFVGTLVYMILRPPEYLEDVQRARTGDPGRRSAPARARARRSARTATTPSSGTSSAVPRCLRKLKERCVSCAKPLDRAWTICPYCETEVPPESSSPPRRRTRRRVAAADASPAGEALPMTASEDLPTVAAPEPASRRPVGDRPARAPVARARPSAGPSEDLVRGLSLLARTPGYDRWPSRGFVLGLDVGPPRLRPCVRASLDPRPPQPHAPIGIGP